MPFARVGFLAAFPIFFLYRQSLSPDQGAGGRGASGPPWSSPFSLHFEWISQNPELQWHLVLIFNRRGKKKLCLEAMRSLGSSREPGNVETFPGSAEKMSSLVVVCLEV